MDFVSPWEVVAAPFGGGCGRRGYRVDGCRSAPSSAAAAAHTRRAPAWRPVSSVGRDAADGAVVLRFETPGFPRDALRLDLSDDATRLDVSGKLTRDGKAPSTRPAVGDAAAADAADAADSADAAGAAAGDAGAKPASAGRGGAGAGPAAADAEVVKSFELAYRLPRDVDAGAITATYELGVLTVRVPKKAVVAESRAIPILD